VALPDHLNPLVLPIEAIAPERHGHVDLYLPQAAQRNPAIVFVHGPVSPDPTPPGKSVLPAVPGVRNASLSPIRSTSASKLMHVVAPRGKVVFDSTVRRLPRQSRS
jgi:hypothetical protein